MTFERFSNQSYCKRQRRRAALDNFYAQNYPMLHFNNIVLLRLILCTLTQNLHALKHSHYKNVDSTVVLDSCYVYLGKSLQFHVSNIRQQTFTVVYFRAVLISGTS